MELAFTTMIILLVIAIILLEGISIWIVYEKLGIEGWKGLIPVYNLIVLIRSANIAMRMIILLFIPIAQLYLLYLVYASLVKKLGKSEIYGILMVIFPQIMFPYLAFSGESNIKVVNEENKDKDVQVILDGPIEPLGAPEDMVVETVVTNVGEIETQVYDEKPEEYIEPSFDSNISNSYLEESLDPIENVVDVSIDDPMAAQDKMQYVEEKKEVYPDVNIFKTCPTCGNKLEPNAKACFLCGTRLGE